MVPNRATHHIYAIFAGIMKYFGYKINNGFRYKFINSIFQISMSKLPTMHIFMLDSSVSNISHISQYTTIVVNVNELFMRNFLERHKPKTKQFLAIFKKIVS